MLKGSTKALLFIIVVASVIAILWNQRSIGWLRSESLSASGDAASPTVALRVTHIAMKQDNTYVGITMLPPNLRNFEARASDSIVFSWDSAHADVIKFAHKITPTGCAGMQASEKTLSDIASSSTGKSKIILPDFADAPAGCTITNEITVTAKNNTNGETATDSFQAVVKK